MDSNEADVEAVDATQSVLFVMNAFGRLDELCCRTNTPRAAELLRNTRVLEIERKKRQVRSSRQVLLTEMLRKAN